MGFLNSLGLMQRTKKGWQAPRVRISSSSDRLNWLLSVGERFLVSAPWGDGPQRWEGLACAPPALQEGTGRWRSVESGRGQDSPGDQAAPHLGFPVTCRLGWSVDPRKQPGSLLRPGPEDHCRGPGGPWGPALVSWITPGKAPPSLSAPASPSRNKRVARPGHLRALGLFLETGYTDLYLNPGPPPGGSDPGQITKQH